MKDHLGLKNSVHIYPNIYELFMFDHLFLDEMMCFFQYYSLQLIHYSPKITEEDSVGHVMHLNNLMNKNFYYIHY